jgi:hypothetical protein
MSNIKTHTVFLVGITLFLLGLTQNAIPQTQRTYAVLSLIGDKLDIVNAAPVTGSNLDRNHHELIPLDNPVFDNAALISAEKAILQHDANAKVTLLRSNEAKLFDLQDRILESKTDADELLKNMLLVVKESQASHIILIAKYRGDANLELQHGNTGHGKLKGLGFYVDRNKKVSRSDTGERGVGFLAPYCYIKAMVIDAQTGAVLRTEKVTKGTAWSAARAKSSTHPWDVFSRQEKITTIERMVKSEAEKLVTMVLNE